MASAIRKFSSVYYEESELRKRSKGEVVKEEKELEEADEVEEEEDEKYRKEENMEGEEDTCVYDEYKVVEDVSDDDEDEPEDYRKYCKYAIKTEGFYVPFAPKDAIGVATPINNKNSFWHRVEKGAILAVDHYNMNRAGPDGQLKLLSLRNVNIRSVGGMLFYITLEAQNVASGEINDYQTRVFMRLDMSMVVQVFRKDPEIVFELIRRDKAGLL